MCNEVSASKLSLKESVLVWAQTGWGMLPGRPCQWAAQAWGGGGGPIPLAGGPIPLADPEPALRTLRPVSGPRSGSIFTMLCKELTAKWFRLYSLEFESQRCFLIALWVWVFFTSLLWASVFPFICKMGIMGISSTSGCPEDWEGK